MNYPIWDLTTFGGGFLIALVAVVHVLVSHFAVGADCSSSLLKIKRTKLRMQDYSNTSKSTVNFSCWSQWSSVA